MVEKLEAKIKEHKRVTIISALITLLGAVLAFIIAPQNIMPITFIFGFVFLINFGITLGLMYANALMEGKTNE